MDVLVVLTAGDDVLGGRFGRQLSELVKEQEGGVVDLGPAREQS